MLTLAVEIKKIPNGRAVSFLGRPIGQFTMWRKGLSAKCIFHGPECKTGAYKVGVISSDKEIFDWPLLCVKPDGSERLTMDQHLEQRPCG